jgi:hypothetical protein
MDSSFSYDASSGQTASARNNFLTPSKNDNQNFWMGDSEDDDFSGTALASISSSSDDDEFWRTAIAASSLKKNHPHHHKHYNARATIELTCLCVVWCLVGLGLVYLVWRERKRRHRRHIRQRQARLEVYSDHQQADRALALMQVLTCTTMCVQKQDLLYHPHPHHPDVEFDSYKDDIEHGRVSSVDKEGNDRDEDGNERTSCIESGQISLFDDESDLQDCYGNSKNSEKDECAEFYPGDEEQGDVDDDDREIQQLCSLDASENSDDPMEDDAWTLQLPIHHTHTPHHDQLEVSATCAICLRRYRVNDKVTWSPRPDNICPHAFHQQCLVEWLAKLPDCNCPICRATFCTLSTTTKS